LATGSKTLERMRENPQGDWTIEDVERVCRESTAWRACRRAEVAHTGRFLIPLNVIS